MPDSGLNYGKMMEQALRGVMAEAISHVADHGLPGEHHFYITFSTRHAGTSMPDTLRKEYPEQMTIVIQHEYDSLAATEEGFSINLSFSGRPSDLFVPWDAVLTFVDPAVEFGLKFEETEPEDDEPEDMISEDDEPEEDAPKGSAEVVSLDRFRKP